MACTSAGKHGIQRRWGHAYGTLLFWIFDFTHIVEECLTLPDKIILFFFLGGGSYLSPPQTFTVLTAWPEFALIAML